MSGTQELKAFLNNLKAKVRQDRNVPDKTYDALVIAISNLVDAVDKMEKAKQMDEASVKTLYENAQSLSLMLDEIKRIRGMGYPSYIDEFVPCITKPPYTMPRTLYEPQGAQQISINIGGQMQAERAELALALLFPGSTTYRYGSPPVKVFLGRWFQSGRARLSSIHELSTKPEFELRIGDRIFRVYKPLTLRGFRMQAQHPICVSCLSLSDGDENCGHSSLQVRAKLPSNYPVIRKLELSRTEADRKTLQKPMAFVVPEATFLKELEVGMAVMGFERTATLRGTSRNVTVDYDPPIGIRLVTSGLSFKANIPEEFVKKALDSDLMLRRDMILQLLSNRLSDIMSEVGLPSYHHELLLSSLISVIGLDDPIEEKMVLQRLRSEGFISSINSAIDRELAFYESARPDATLVQSVITLLQTFDITEDNLYLKLYQTILHSLAHVLLLATAVTSGSQLDDLDYLVREERGEVVVFDAVSGGNGSSETAFEFLSETGKFSVEAYWQSEEREEIYRPRNFDETAFEFLLPCVNGVADSTFLFGRVSPLESEIKRKLSELNDKATTHRTAITKIKEYGSSKIFPIGIGYHAMNYSNRPQEADRFKEAANICLHGCPECISIGRKCHVGSFYEKYNISKFALDEMVNYLLQGVTISELSPNEILSTLTKYGIAVVKGSCNEQQACKDLVNNLSALVLELVGREINGGHVKFAGHWVNTDLTFGALSYHYMFKVI
jgi:hypothetical protein